MLTAKEFLLLQYLAAQSRPRAVARRAADRRVGLHLHGRHPHGGRARAAPARETAASSSGTASRSSSSGISLLDHAARAGMRTLTVPRASFQTKLFLAGAVSAVLALAVAGVLFAMSMRRQTERTGRTDADDRRAPGGGGTRCDARRSRRTGDSARSMREADRIGALLEARVTLIAADGARPRRLRRAGSSARRAREPRDATGSGAGRASERPRRRRAVPARRIGDRHALRRAAGCASDDRLRPRRAAADRASASSSGRHPDRHPRRARSRAARRRSRAPAILAGRIGQRVARHRRRGAALSQGDLTPPRLDYGDDELGVVARALDDSVHELGDRIERAGARPRPDRGDSRWHGRRRHRRRRQGRRCRLVNTRRAGHAADRRCAARASLPRNDPASGDHRPGDASARRPSAGVARVDAAARSSTRTIIGRAAPVDRRTAAGVVLVLHDITELRRADQMRRDFVANVSHELRTPLTAIRGYVEALSEGDTNSRRIANASSRSSCGTRCRMERLVKDLLRLARLDAGQETLDIVDVRRPRRSSRRSFADLAPALERTRTGCATSRSSAAPNTVQADPAKLHDVLRNLIANASAYAPEDGTITVAARTRRRVVDDRCAGRGSRHSRRAIASGCSSASTAWTSRAPAIPAARGSASRSCSTWSNCTADG